MDPRREIRDFIRNECIRLDKQKKDLAREYHIRELQVDFNALNKKIEALIDKIKTLPNAKKYFGKVKRKYEKLQFDFKDVFTFTHSDPLAMGATPPYLTSRLLDIERAARDANEDRLRDAVNQIRLFHQELSSQVQTETLKVTIDQLKNAVRNLTREYPASHPKFQVDINQLHASKKALEDAYLRAQQNLENTTVSIENLRTTNQLLTKFLTHERHFKELLRSELEVVKQGTDIETAKTYLQHKAIYPTAAIIQLEQDYNNYLKALERASNVEERLPEKRRVYHLLEVYDDLSANSYCLSERLGYFQRYNEARNKLDEFRTLYSKAYKLWSKYHRELQQVFPEKYKKFLDQAVNIRRKVEDQTWLENREDLVKASRDLEKEKELLTETSDLCLKIEKVHPLLTIFNQICQHLKPVDSSQNVDQILANLDEPSGDSLLVRKIREAFGQDFQKFQKLLWNIAVCIHTTEIISKDPKELEGNTQWLAEKLEDYEEAKDRLIAGLQRKGFSEKTASELTALTLKDLHGIHNTAYERIQAYMDLQGPREEEMRRVILPQKLGNIRECLHSASSLKNLDEKELPQKSEDLITHYAQLSRQLKHFQVLEAALSNQHALSKVRKSILDRDASQYRENITRGLEVFQVTLSTSKLEEISNYLNNDLKQIEDFIQKETVNLIKAMYAPIHKTSRYLNYIKDLELQAYKHHKDVFPKDFITKLKENVQIYNEMSIPDQRSIDDLWKRYNDLDTARKDISQALKTYEEPFLQEARLILREIDHTLKECSEPGILSVKQDLEGGKEIPFHDLISGCRSALEDACIAYHSFPITQRMIKELLEDFGTRFEQVCSTDQRDQKSSSPIEKMQMVNDNLKKKLEERRSTIQQMRITEREIAHIHDIESIKANDLTAAKNKIKEINAIHVKITKYCNLHRNQIEQDYSEEYDNLIDQLETSYKKVEDQTWLEKCEDLVKASRDLEEEKQQLTGILETWQKKYKDVQVQSKLEDLRTTYEKILQCFAKDASHTYDQILKDLDDPSQISLLGKVIRKEFGPEQFTVFCRYLRTLSHIVRKDPTTDKYMLQATPDRRFIRHRCLALNDMLNQFKRTKDLINRVKGKLGDNPTEEQLNQYLSDQSQKYTYTQIELYQHWTDDNKEVKLYHWQTNMQDLPLLSRKEEDHELTELQLEKIVKILTYAEELEHTYYNCHSLTFTDGKAGWLGPPQQIESILTANGFKKVWMGNVVTDQDYLPPDASVQVGDVIVYRQREETDIQHTGYVSKVEDGKISIISKWAHWGIYEHNISNINLNYGPYYEIYHTNRPTDDPLKARLLKRADSPSVRAWVRKPVAPDA